MGIAAYNRGSRAISRQIDEELKEKVTGVCVVHPIAEPQEPKQKGVLGYWNLIDDPVDVKVGDRVFCTVTGCRGWYTVEAIKGPKRDLRIKISFSKQWAYGHNFTREPAEWMLK